MQNIETKSLPIHSTTLIASSLQWFLSASCILLSVGLSTAMWAQSPSELQPVAWTLGTSGATHLSINAEGGLTKTTEGSTTWAGGIATKNILRDGCVVFSGVAGGLSHFAVGLNLDNANELNTDLDHAILLKSDNTAQVYHGATAGVTLGAYTSQTIFTIRRTGSQVQYFKDAVLLHTSSTASAGIMKVDCAFFAYGGIISAIFDNMCNVPLWRQCNLWLANTSITYFEYVDRPHPQETWRLHFLGRTEHLQSVYEAVGGSKQ